ncbi:Cdc6/Cdc18 family protein [Saliphagus infecundisoli]|uniref:Cdc6/Cdc18 family protein n=1 Tax=Saliphagus infecundisoli TaxID=1849069 RepID=A0ABD5QC57_9EURY|nr:AAA family ATPase [Saliphagus infecundisoli]
MDIGTRIERRQRRYEKPRLIRNYGSLLPVAHVDEPSNRGPVLEQLLDHLDPVFGGELPPNAYVHGPFGSGKSAIVRALFAHLGGVSRDTYSIVHTSTRAVPPTVPEFVYIDMREVTSEFAFCHGVLNALVDEPVPDHGVSTAEFRERLYTLLGSSQAVVAVDHVDDPGGIDAADLADLFAGLPSTVSWLAIGRDDPDETSLSRDTATSIRVERYRRRVLVDVLMARASAGLAHQALAHDLARRIAVWAEGNAHDGLTALFVAADRADREGHTRLAEADVTAAIDEIPRPSVSLDRVLSLPANKLLVLGHLVDVDPDDRVSVTATTEAISAEPDVDLSAGTVKRFLYEMAETGIVERVQSHRSTGKGRPPSRLELRFPPIAFRRLYDFQQ